MMKQALCAFGISILSAFPALATDSMTVGGEIFRDTYKEYNDFSGPAPHVDIHTDYGSVTATAQHTFTNHYFTAIDGRYSWGEADYKSVSGTLNNIPDFETDVRGRVGFDVVMYHGVVMPYVGVGWRYYFDQGKNKVSSTGAVAYDRHISQVYFPLGMSYRYMSGDWTFTPAVEYDPIFWGRVSSHLGFATAGFAPGNQVPNIVNKQHGGYGLRGEFMVGQQYKYFNWEAGPFVRYWHFSDSDLSTPPGFPAGTGFIEPKNTRLQTGAALRVGF